MSMVERNEAAAKLMRSQEDCETLVRLTAAHRGAPGRSFEELIGALCVVVTGILDARDAKIQTRLKMVDELRTLMDRTLDDTTSDTYPLSGRK